MLSCSGERNFLITGASDPAEALAEKDVAYIRIYIVLYSLQYCPSYVCGHSTPEESMIQFCPGRTL